MSTALTKSQNKVIQFNDMPVVTTEQLANFYNTETVRIQQNYLRNSNWFIEGKHFFRLDGDELRDFKKALASFKIVSANARHLILWTERGAARHAKMLDTDHAWDVFEQLEDNYFNHLTRPSLPDSVSKADHERAILNYYGIFRKYDSMIDVLRKQIDEIEHSQALYRCKLEEYAISIDAAAQALNTSVKSIQDRLIRENLIEVHMPYIQGIPPITRLTERGQKLNFVLIGNQILDGFVRDAIKITDDGMKFLKGFF